MNYDLRFTIYDFIGATVRQERGHPGRRAGETPALRLMAVVNSLQKGAK